MMMSCCNASDLMPWRRANDNYHNKDYAAWGKEESNMLELIKSSYVLWFKQYKLIPSEYYEVVNIDLQ